MTRWTVYFATAVLAGAAEGVLLAPRPVEAVAREILGLQEDLKQLTQAQKESETTLVQNAAVDKTLIEQLMDTAHKMRDDMTNLEKRVEEMRAASGGRMDAMNTQTEGVSDGIQATLESLGKINQQLVDLKNALRGVDAKLAERPPSSGAAVPVTPRGRKNH